MAEVETVVLPHLADYPLFVALYKDVTNANFLRQQLLEGNSDFEYAFLDAQVILSRTQILAACFRAVNDMVHNRLKSRNVHSEIVFSLSPNNNIAESFRRFGITDTTKDVLAIKVRVSPEFTSESVSQHLTQQVKGQAIEVSDEILGDLVDLARLKKIYKLNAPPKKGGSGIVSSAAAERDEMESSILGAMALKGS
ncbi:hypothetical protein AAFC00_007270 [Neodothiora populina]|uniref:EKC/KEOPS complex subunit CGI121 n=1 Tax=Neodothiora populina TaxID=2781224 RepID=A0ABR3PHZ7_9PEZI